MRTKDIELQTPYLYETSRRYGRNHGDRFYVLSHDTYRDNPGLSYGPEPKERYVAHPRGTYLPYRATSGLLAIRVSGYAQLTEADEKLLQSVTLNEVLAGHGRLPRRLDDCLQSDATPELTLVQSRFLTGKWAVRQQEIAEAQKAAEEAQAARKARVEAEKAKMEAALEVLNKVLDRPAIRSYDYGQHNVELSLDQVAQLADIVKAALPSLFKD